jgi:hypothetical protein
VTQRTRITVRLTVGSETTEVSLLPEEGNSWDSGAVSDSLARETAQKAFSSALDSLVGLVPREQDTETLPPDLGCTMPPAGWWCSIEPGHDGPCAAREK